MPKKMNIEETITSIQFENPEGCAVPLTTIFVETPVWTSFKEKTMPELKDTFPAIARERPVGKSTVRSVIDLFGTSLVVPAESPVASFLERIRSNETRLMNSVTHVEDLQMFLRSVENIDAKVFKKKVS